MFTYTVYQHAGHLQDLVLLGILVPFKTRCDRTALGSPDSTLQMQDKAFSLFTIGSVHTSAMQWCALKKVCMYFFFFFQSNVVQGNLLHHPMLQPIGHVTL